MRRLFISADIEGCAAVSSPHALAPERWEWTAARKWMTQEVIAGCEAAFAAGYDEVVVADSHHNAHNIDPDALPDNVRLVRSWPRPLLHMQGVQEPHIDACAFIGLHAGSGSRDSILAHTFHGGAFRSVRMNAEPCSEGYLNAALAGEFGVPVIFVSGDEQTIADARRYAPDAVGFVAKTSIGWRSQMSLPPAQVRRMLKDAMAHALRRSSPRPFVLQGPFRLELEMMSPVAAEMLAYLPGVERIGAWSIIATFGSIEAAMRFVSFAMLYSPTGAIAL
jgi:D-amino peptidase